jgi:tetratricopeptide (TPR) repeat protein
MFTRFRRTRVHTLPWSVLVTLPFLAAACGGDKPAAKAVESVAVSDIHPTPPPPPTATASFASNTTPVVTTSSVEATPHNAFGFYMLGLSRLKAGDFERARTAFATSIDLDPAFAKTYFNDARALLALNRGPEALEQVKQGLSIDSMSGDGWRLKARAQAASGDVDSAVQTYHTLLMHNDEDEWGLNNLGMLLLDQGDTQGALGPLARLVILRPTAPLFQNNFGVALERAGYPVAALHHYEAAVQDDSTFTRAVKNAARLRASVTDTTGADEVDVQALAEDFRVQVKTWKDVVVPVGNVVVKPDTSVPPDSLIPRTTGDPVKHR